MEEFRFKLNIWDNVELTKGLKNGKSNLSAKTQALCACSVNEKFITVWGV